MAAETRQLVASSVKGSELPPGRVQQHLELAECARRVLGLRKSQQVRHGHELVQEEVKMAAMLERLEREI